MLRAAAVSKVPPPSVPPNESPAKAWLAFAACGVIWGSTFLAISVGNDALAPIWAATLRLLLATLLLSGWTIVRGDSFPRGAALNASLAYGVCQFGINFPLLYWGEKVVPSGVAAVFYATIPLSSALFARAFQMERLTFPKVAGAVVAFAGVAVLFSSSVAASGGAVAPRGMAAIFVGATAASLGSVFLKRGPRQSAVGANAVGCAIGALMCGVLSVGLGESHALPTTLRALFPLLYLTIAGSLGAFVIMSWLVHRWVVSRTSYVTVIVPVVALALGNLFRRERLTVFNLVGSVLVLTGLVIGMRSGSSASKPT